MKIRLTFKTLDVIENMINEYFNNIYSEEEEYDEFHEESFFEERENQISLIEDICSKYIKYGEYCTIEIDTETQEARIIPIDET